MLKSEQNPSFWPICLLRPISITRRLLTSTSINLYMYIESQTFSTFENVLIAKQSKQLPNHGANLKSHEAVNTRVKSSQAYAMEKNSDIITSYEPFHYSLG